MLVNVNGKSLVDHIYPIGSIYFSTVNENPSKNFGGTWTTWGSGRVPVGADGEGGSGGVIATHTTRVTKLDGNDPELLQPYITCYMWKRIA